MSLCIDVTVCHTMCEPCVVCVHVCVCVVCVIFVPMCGRTFAAGRGDGTSQGTQRSEGGTRPRRR